MKVSILPASIPYVDNPMPEWVDEWGVQLFTKVNLGDYAGYGEVLIAGSGIISAYIGVFEDLIIPYLENVEVVSINEVVEKLEKMLYSAGLCSITLGSISGVETALWHVFSKMRNMKIYEFFGGKIRDRVPVYASFPRYKSVDDIVSAVKVAIDRGFTLVKLHQQPQMIEDALKKIREIFGFEIKIAIDFNSAFDYSSALSFLNKIHRYEIEWYEEPIYPPNDYDNLKRLAEKFPISAGENEYTINSFRKLIESGIEYVQPDISKIGGYLKMIKVIDLAESYGVKVMPHLRPQRSGIALFHTLQLALAKRNIVQVEFPLAQIPSELFNAEFNINNGLVKVPEDVSLNEEILREKYNFTRKLRILKFADLAT